MTNNDGPITAPGANRRTAANSSGTVATGDRVEDEVKGADDEVRDGEDHSLGPERRWRREGYDQHRGRRGEHDQALAALFGSRCSSARHRRPTPTTARQAGARPEEPFPALVRGEEPGHLRDGEDEDEVEEQLQRRHPLLALDRTNVHRGQISPGPDPAGLRSAASIRATPTNEAVQTAARVNVRCVTPLGEEVARSRSPSRGLQAVPEAFARPNRIGTTAMCMWSMIVPPRTRGSWSGLRRSVRPGRPQPRGPSRAFRRAKRR